MTDLTIANTIIDQINTIDYWARARWGVTGGKGMRPIGLENGVKFKSRGMVKWKGWVTITLNGMDLYDIEFSRIYAGEHKIDKVVIDVFVEDLVKIIDAQVG